ncbi:MAG: hypothetical protein WCL21_18255, partial [Mariniphaga sp.]
QGDQRRTIQAQSPQRERSHGRQGVKLSVVQLDEVGRGRCLPGIPQRRLGGVRRPVIGFVLITARAAIEEVVKRVASALGRGSEVIHRQQSPGVRLGYATEFARANRPAADHDEVEVTAMGDTAHRFVKGLESGSFSCNFYNDTATGKVLPTLQAAYGTLVTCVLKNTQAAVSATNPTYTFTALINKLTPVNGKVTDLSMQSITWTISGPIVYAIV